MSFFPNADLGKVWRGRKKKKKPECQRNGKKYCERFVLRLLQELLLTLSVPIIKSVNKSDSRL